MNVNKKILIAGWFAFVISGAGYAYFGSKEISKNISADEKKRIAGLMTSSYVGGAGTATLIVYGLMKNIKKQNG